jgi:hypothetical protein
MRKFLLAAAAGALLVLPLPASASSADPVTDVSAQTVRVGPGGVTIRDRHRRGESRRARRGRDRCVTRTVTRFVDGRRVTRRTRVCD